MFGPLLHRVRKQPLWTQGQLQQPEIQERIACCSAWLQLNLPGKDLLIVGFWTGSYQDLSGLTGG
jgi:hypothetical protein